MEGAAGHDGELVSELLSRDNPVEELVADTAARGRTGREHHVHVRIGLVRVCNRSFAMLHRAHGSPCARSRCSIPEAEAPRRRDPHVRAAMRARCSPSWPGQRTWPRLPGLDPAAAVAAL